MRLDVWLFTTELAPSRQKAKEWIESGRVFVENPNGPRTLIKKSSFEVDEQNPPQVFIQSDEQDRFVSRGGLKLNGAFEFLRTQPNTRVATDLKGQSVLDVGMSTGGFADCCLQLGAKRVVGVDVGHGQLAESLRLELAQPNSRLRSLEGVNAREMDRTPHRDRILDCNDGLPFDWVVIDVSFISLRLVLPAVVSFLKPLKNGSGGRLLALVKPQFEVGRAGLGKGGIVKNPKLYLEVESSVRSVSASLGLKVESYFESSITGTDGNREFFIYATILQNVST